MLSDSESSSASDSFSDSSNISPVKVTSPSMAKKDSASSPIKTPRPKRNRSQTMKVKESVDTISAELTSSSKYSKVYLCCQLLLAGYLIGIAVVKCCQTNKKHKAKLSDLQREDGEQLTVEYLTKGSNLMLQIRGKHYPVQFMNFQGKNYCCILYIAIENNYKVSQTV